MVIPVGPEGAEQKLAVVDKKLDGSVYRKDVMGVVYVSYFLSSLLFPLHYFHTIVYYYILMLINTDMGAFFCFQVPLTSKERQLGGERR